MRILLACLILAGLACAESLPRDGFELHYRTVGKGPILILLSGGPGLDVDYMQAVADKLADSYTCVLLEQRGTGRSRPPKIDPSTMTLAKVVDDVEALRLRLKLDTVTLVGHSWGGMLAMAYAAAHPPTIDRLVLIAPGGMDAAFRSYLQHNVQSRLWPEDRKAADAAKSPSDALTALLPGYFYDRQKALAYAKARSADALHADVNMTLTMDLLRNYNVRETLKQVDRPALIVQGRQDPIGESTAYETHLTLRKSSLQWIDECGHFPWVEQPDQFFKIVREFLAR